MRVPVILISLSLFAVANAEAGKAERKKEIKSLRQELRYVDLRAREDLRAAGPAPGAGAVVELEDGSVYVLKDSSIVFEKLGPLRLNKLSLRDGHRLIVTLHPPSDIRPRMVRSTADGWNEPPVWERTGPTGPVRGRSLVTSLDLDEHASVREALSTLVYLPSDSPSVDEHAACVARYPQQVESMSLMRCGEAP